MEVTEKSIEKANVEIIESSQRTTAELVIEIKRYMKQTGENIIEIGKCLIEAKKQVPHGEWGDWLSINIDFTQNTANRFMRCAERFSNCAPAHNLNSSQMFELLALKSSDTEKFIDVQANAGTPVENMSKKTLREEVKKWKSEQPKRDVKANKREKSPQKNNADESRELNSFFALVDGFDSGKEFKQLIYNYAKENPKQFTKYAEKLVQISKFVNDIVNKKL